MLKDDKCGICWGRLVPMDEFGKFDGSRFTLDEASPNAYAAGLIATFKGAVVAAAYRQQVIMVI